MSRVGSLVVYLQNKIHFKEINRIPEEGIKNTMVCELRRVKLRSEIRECFAFNEAIWQFILTMFVSLPNKSTTGHHLLQRLHMFVMWLVAATPELVLPSSIILIFFKMSGVQKQQLFVERPH